MGGHAFDERVGQPPFVGDAAAQGGVVETEFQPLGRVGRDAPLGHPGQHRLGQIGFGHGHDQPAHVVEQTGHEKTFRRRLVATPGQPPGQHAHGHGVTPEIGHGQQLGPGRLVEQPGQHRAGGQIDDLGEANEAHGPADGLHPDPGRVDGAVGQAQHVGGQTRVQGHGLGHVGHAAHGVLGRAAQGQVGFGQGRRIDVGQGATFTLGQGGGRSGSRRRRGQGLAPGGADL